MTKSVKSHISFDSKSHENCLTTLILTKSLFNKTGIITSVAKSDEIGKITHLVWLQIPRELLNDTFSIILRENLSKSLFKLQISLFKAGPHALQSTF